MNNTQASNPPEVVVGVYVRHTASGKVLLTKSSKWTVWGVHGGHVDFGETIAEAAVRETQEEVGLNTRFVKVLRYRESIHPPAFNRDAHLIVFHCLVESDSDEVHIDGVEIVDYRWIHPSDISQYPTGENVATTMSYLQHPIKEG